MIAPKLGPYFHSKYCYKPDASVLLNVEYFYSLILVLAYILTVALSFSYFLKKLYFLQQKIFSRVFPAFYGLRSVAVTLFDIDMD